jgi:hypothetical protein
MEHDEVCSEKGIPVPLHRCERPVVEQFAETERLYRRVKLPCNDWALQVSFRKKNSSVNRSRFSNPDDARWDTEKGRYCGDYAVISFPASAYSGKQWKVSEEPTIPYSITVFHNPLRCNYAHTDFQFYRAEAEVDEITKKSVKMQIRSVLRPLIHQEC